MPELDFISHPLSGTPFGTALEVCLILAAVAWLLSVVTREVSWIDRLWSICPPVYCLIVAAAMDFDSARVNLMTVLVVVWGIRLTCNFARYTGPGSCRMRRSTGWISWLLLCSLRCSPVRPLPTGRCGTSSRTRNGGPVPGRMSPVRSSPPGFSATPAIPTTVAKSACGGSSTCSGSRRPPNGCTGRVWVSSGSRCSSFRPSA